MEPQTAQQLVQAVEQMGSTSWPEAITMITQVVMAIATAFLLGGLLYQWKTFQLQRKTMRASLFKEISTRIDSLLDQQSSSEEMGDNIYENWLERLINAFEYYAFFVNRDYLDPEMQTYYKSAIKDTLEWVKDCPKTIEHLKAGEEDELEELKTYCEKYNIAVPF